MTKGQNPPTQELAQNTKISVREPGQSVASQNPRQSVIQTPPGYKQTEVGVIPEDWQVKPLIELTTEIGDGIHATPEYVKSSEFFFINGNNLIAGSIAITENTMCVSEAEYKRLRQELNGRTILLSINGTIGNLAFFNDEKVVLGKSAAYINVAHNATRKYVFYSLQSDATTNYFEDELTGTTIRNLSLNSIRNTPIPVPATIQEQQAIAAALSDVDALISALGRLIAKKRAIKQASMQQLLTGKTRLPGFSEEWEVKQLGELAEVIDPHPSHRAPKVDKNGIPFVGIGDIATDGSISYQTARFVGEGVFHEHSERYNLADELLGIGRVASIGKVVRLLSNIGKYAVSPTIAVIKPLKVHSDILFHCLLGQATSNQFNRIKSGSTRQAVGIMVLRDIELRLPKSPEEQQAIAAILSDMDAEIAALEQRRDKTRALKQGMMQELLTGKTRLL